MALRTPEDFIQSIADLDLEIYLFGERLDDYVDNPVIRPSLNCIAMTYELAAQARVRRADDGHEPSDGQDASTASPTSISRPTTS